MIQVSYIVYILYYKLCIVLYDFTISIKHLMMYFLGISHWLPASKDLKYYESWEDVPEQWQTQVRPKMFPPKPEDATKFHFERW